jgi:hypothetical protein
MKKAWLMAFRFGMTGRVIAGLLEFAFRWSGRLRAEINERSITRLSFLNERQLPRRVPSGRETQPLPAKPGRFFPD